MAKAAAARNAAAKAAAESTAAADASEPIAEADDLTASPPGADAETATLSGAQPEASEAEPPIQELPPVDEPPSPGDTASADLAEPEPFPAAADETPFVGPDDDRTRENPIVSTAVTTDAIAPASAEPVVVDETASTAIEAEPAVVEPVIADEPAAEPPAIAPASTAPATEVAGPEAIRIRGLAKHFGDHRAVNGIDLTIPAGSFYGIVGPNGAGKTTTLSIVAGLLRADEGSVVVCGIDQAAEPLAAKRVMGVLPDRLRTFDRLTGRQLLYYYGLLRGLSSDVIEKRAADLARAFDLSDALSRVVSDYSAGMTKKIMLAGAMIHSPRVLVLDEPFEAVDPVSSAVILDILRAYVAHGGTVVLSSHGMDLVERVCSRVAIIVGGDVLAEGTIEEVRAGQTLESRFVELSGGIGEVEGLEWLHTFSD
ncbi:MAG TPA: ATP-binding cassette domain-containing protein [Microbacterium sp.]|nr:ATP-binding cassette domain-containing protein [Microbacterium sp.]